MFIKYSLRLVITIISCISWSWADAARSNHLVMHLRASDRQWDPSLNIKLRGVLIEKGLSNVGITRWLNFNGYRDLIKIPDSEKLDPGESFSVALWVCPRNHGQSGKRRSFLISKGWNSSNHGEFCLSLKERTGKEAVLCLQVANLQNEGQKQIETLFSDTVIPFEKWCHVAAVFDKGKMQLFLNGHLEAEKTCQIRHTEKGEYPHDDISIGGLPWGDIDGYGFRGKMDDVRYYSNAIDQKLISDLFWKKMPIKALQRRGDVEMEFRLSSPLASVRFNAIHDYLALPLARRQAIARWFASPSSSREIGSLLKQLSSDEYVERQQATRKLALIGKKILPLVEQSLKTERDPEVKARLKALSVKKLREKKCRIGLESVRRSRIVAKK